MTEESIKQCLDAMKDLVIYSNTRINYLLQIGEMAGEKNRIILRFSPFFALVQRDLNGAMLTAVRSLRESDRSTYNLATLIETIRKSTIDEENKKLLEPILNDLTQLIEHEIPKKATIIASTSYAHKSIKKPTKEVIVTYAELRDYLSQVGALLNQVSGILWRSSTLMHIPESEGDGFKKGMNHLEIAEDIGTWMLRLHDDHKLVKERKAFMKKMKRPRVK